jgi:phospholipid/cholesterol/gamma-HCH transport system permease protein
MRIGSKGVIRHTEARRIGNMIAVKAYLGILPPDPLNRQPIVDPAQLLCAIAIPPGDPGLFNLAELPIFSRDDVMAVINAKQMRDLHHIKSVGRGSKNDAPPFGLQLPDFGHCASEEVIFRRFRRKAFGHLIQLCTPYSCTNKQRQIPFFQPRPIDQFHPIHQRRHRHQWQRERPPRPIVADDVHHERPERGRARDRLIHIKNSEAVLLCGHCSAIFILQLAGKKGIAQLSSPMQEKADFAEAQSGDRTVIRFHGRLTLARIGNLSERLGALAHPGCIVDLSEIERIDTIGAWVVHKFATAQHATISGADPVAQRLLQLVANSGEEVRVRPEAQNPVIQVLGQVGDAVAEAGRTMVGLVSFLGAIVVELLAILRHPSKLRLNAVVHRFELVGVNALGIIGLMSFLIGIVIAQQGAVQLAEFGLQSMTVNLVGIASARELGVLMTAIMVAGRSGSAFAAQLGTMKLTEEIDAMRTIGVSPISALVIPRMAAAILMMPLLGFYATIMAMIGGGLFCWGSLGIPPAAYIDGLQGSVRMIDMTVGLIKAPVFGLLIALTGCYQGMQVQGDAEQVGLRTTAAVVQAIFLVIVLDAFFAVFFTAIGWD